MNSAEQPLAVATRSRRALWFIPLAIACGLSLWFLQNRISGTGWNVVLITLDTTRADHIGCYGATDGLTPALDGLASRAVVFDKAYAPAPLTLSSHATMFTGLLPPEHGLITNGKGRLPDEIKTFAEVLSEAGYATSAFVASYVLNARFGLNQGIHTYDDDLTGTVKPHDQLHRERQGDVVVDRALKWLTNHRAKKFHCWIHLYDPHFPYQAHEQLFGSRFQRNPYDGEIAFVDQQVARILTFLRTEKLDGNTLVVIVGDHGEGLGEHEELTHSYLLYRSTMHVPLIIAPPGEHQQTLHVEQAISLVDLSPTLLELLRLPIPKSMTGSSLAGVWRGEAISPRDCFSMTDEPFLDNQWAPLRSLTTDQWKYIRSPKPELYDLRVDPFERKNLVSEDLDQVAEMEERLLKVEEGMRIRNIADTGMSAKEKRTLASLGYTGSFSNRNASAAVSTIDVKDMLPLYNKLTVALELLEHGNAAEAEPALRSIVDAAPSYLKAWGNLGISLAQQQKWDEAIDCYQRVLSADPSDVSALMNLGAASTVNGRRDDAIQYYSKSLDADPRSAISHLRLAQLYGESGDAKRAVSHFSKAVDLDPEFDEAHRSWGDFATAQDDPRSARLHYDSAMKLNPNSIPAIVNRGILDAKSGNTESAKQFFLRALELDPKNFVVRSNLGMLYEQNGKILDAVKEYESVLQQSPEHFPTLISLGWIRAAHSNPSVRRTDQAIELAERACQISERRSFAALDLMSAVFAETGQFAKAAATLDEASNLVQPGQRPSKRELLERAERYRSRIPAK